jgi:glycine/D-amino acid oxidase-like deaminating enzyme
MRRDWDAIVVGLGALGSAAAYWLSRRFGDRVLGLEQFDLDHDNGASRDHSRIIRLSYHRPHYVRLARRAYETWAQVEAESGTTIVTRTGGLDVAPREAAIPLCDYTASLDAESVPIPYGQPWPCRPSSSPSSRPCRRAYQVRSSAWRRSSSSASRRRRSRMSRQWGHSAQAAG